MGSSCHLKKKKKNVTTVHDFGPSAFQQATQLLERTSIYFLWSEYEKMKYSYVFLEKLYDLDLCTDLYQVSLELIYADIYWPWNWCEAQISLRWFFGELIA